MTSTSVKQSRSKEEFGTFCNPHLDEEENVEGTWDHLHASPLLIAPTPQPVHHLNPISPFKQSLTSNSWHHFSSQDNPSQQFAPEVHLQQSSNSIGTFHPSISQDPLNILGPLQQSSEDPYNEDIWAAYSKKAQDVLSCQRRFESGSESSGPYIRPTLQISSIMDLLLSRLRIYEPPNIDNTQSWLKNFDSIFRFRFFILLSLLLI